MSADTTRPVTLGDLDARLREVEALQDLMMRIIATTKPLDRVLEQYGATQSQERAFYTLLDELVVRARWAERDRPTFGYFQMRLFEIFPALKNDRAFVQLVIDTMKLERPVYRELHVYTDKHGWPQWS